MPMAPMPSDEGRRHAALHDPGILDSGSDEAFDSLVKVASVVTCKPIALISLLDGERQWFKANLGLAGMPDTSRAKGVSVFFF